MTTRLLLLFVFLYAQSLSAQSTEPVWKFVGVLTPEKNGCTPKTYRQYRHEWLKINGAYSGKIAALKAKEPVAQIVEYTVTSKKPFYIALVARTVNTVCQKKLTRVITFAYAGGASKEAVLAALDQEKKVNKQFLSYQIKEWIDASDAVSKMTTESASAKSIYPGHQGLTLVATGVKESEERTTMILTYTNNRKDSTFLLEVIGKEGLGMLEELKPGESLTKTYQTNKIQVHAKLRPVNATKSAQADFPLLPLKTTGLLELIEGQVVEDWL